MTRGALDQVPVTYDRAATELVQARRHLEEAGDCLRLALEILERLPAHGAVPRREVLGVREALTRLDSAGMALRGAAGR